MAQNPFEFTLAQQAIPALRAPGPKVFGNRAWPDYTLPLSDTNVWDTGAYRWVKV